MTQRRRLLACLPIALAPAASATGLAGDGGTVTVTDARCVVGCAEGAAHEALQGAVDAAAAEGRLDGAPPVLARCPFCGRGFGPAVDTRTL